MAFIDTGVPVYVHDVELTNALWCLFTKVGKDAKVYWRFTSLTGSKGRCWTISAIVSDSSSQLADVQ